MKKIGNKPLTAAERQKRYRERNPERIKENLEKYKNSHPNASKEAQKKYYYNNCEKEKERAKKWKMDNPEKEMLIKKRYYEKNYDRVRAYQKEYKQNNLDKSRGYSHRYRANKKNNGVFLILEKEIINILSSPCFICGSKENIHIDHIIPISRGGRHSIGNLQPLCKKCNFSKGSKLFYEWKLSVII